MERFMFGFDSCYPISAIKSKFFVVFVKASEESLPLFHFKFSYPPLWEIDSLEEEESVSFFVLLVKNPYAMK